MLVLLALSATLDRLPATDSASQEPSLADVEMWILGENPETIEPLTGEIPEYVFFNGLLSTSYQFECLRRCSLCKATAGTKRP